MSGILGRWLVFAVIMLLGSLLVALLISLISGQPLQSLPPARFIGPSISVVLVSLFLAVWSTKRQTKTDGGPRSRPKWAIPALVVGLLLIAVSLLIIFL